MGSFRGLCTTVLLCCGVMLSLRESSATPMRVQPARKRLMLSGPSGATLGHAFNVVARPPRSLRIVSTRWTLEGSPRFVKKNRLRISFEAQSAGTYVFRFSAKLAGGRRASATLSVLVTAAGGGPSQSPSPAGILLNDQNLAKMRAAAAAETPQWLAFKERLDQRLTEIDLSQYQASSLGAISDYALGYQILYPSDPRTAADYADKAIGLLKAGLRDYQKGGWSAYQYLARGDGSTKTFALMNADVIPSTVHAYLADVDTVAVTKGRADTTDEFGYYYHIIKVSDSRDGPPDYGEGSDWIHHGHAGNNQIDWSPAGKEPARGATYYITRAPGIGATNAAVTVSGHSITFASAPGQNKAIFVTYIYGTHSDDGSTLAYQQTSAGDGGFNSIYIDTGYTSRYLGKHMAMGVDWLDGYKGLDADLRQQIMDLLAQWSDYYMEQGYYRDSIQSNYGAGAYVSRMLTALALEKRHVDGPRLMQEAIDFRQNEAVPQLLGSGASLLGGFWAEGWNYGPLAAQNVLLAGLALENSEHGAATEERTWAAQAIRSLVQSEGGHGAFYNNGDWYAYPVPLPGKELFYVLGGAAADQPEKGYADYVIQNYPGGQSADYLDMLFRDPAATAGDWTASMPPHLFHQGTGLLLARADWSYASTWLSFQLGNLLSADHQGANPGHMQIQRGADDLLVNANAVAENQDPHSKSSFSNLIAIDDNGEGAQVYRWNMGFWYGTPGVFVTSHEESDAYVYAAGNYRNAYSLNTAPDQGGSASELTRELFFVRPNYIFVYDRAATIKDTYPKRLQWHALTAPAVAGNSWMISSGASKLFGATFSSSGIATAAAAVDVSGTTVYRIATDTSAPQLSVRYATALQVAPSSQGAMDASAFVASSDGRLEGALLGSTVVLFAKDAALSPFTGTTTYSFTAATATTHFVTGLEAARSYTVRVDGVALPSAKASASGVMNFSVSSGGTHTLSIS